MGDNRDDNLERDPKLARLLEAAGREEPPAALDAAILAAARQEVGARPQVVSGGSGETGALPVRVKRNWYVPVSIAAVLVLSVSLVTLVHQEKGEELAQPPTISSGTQSAGVPPQASVPAPGADAPDTSTASPSLPGQPAQPRIAEQKQAESAKAVAAPDATGQLARKQDTLLDKPESATDNTTATLGTVRKDQPAGVAVQTPQAGPGAAIGGPSAGTPPSAPPAFTSERWPEPFPATSEREAPASSPAPASRDAAEARARNEADRGVARGALPEAPAPSAKAAPAPRRSAPAEVGQTPSAAVRVEDRLLATPPPPAAQSSLPPPPKPTVRAAEKRAPVWRGLEDQPPEKWLERLAEFKQDRRQADADELLAEFRRRFPDHPAGAR